MTSPAPDDEFLEESIALEAAYLQGADRIQRSGFGGGATRWEAERRPLTEGVVAGGSFLDVGCANGHLASCVVDWTAQRAITIEPFGVDLGAKLIAEAQSIHGDLAKNFVAADAWAWRPARRFTYVYSLLDLSPDRLLAEWIERLLSWVEPGGRLIVGSYGSVSRGVAPADVSELLAGLGYRPVGESSGGAGPVTRFAWIEQPAG